MGIINPSVCLPPTPPRVCVCTCVWRMYAYTHVEVWVHLLGCAHVGPGDNVRSCILLFFCFVLLKRDFSLNLVLAALIRLAGQHTPRISFFSAPHSAGYPWACPTFLWVLGSQTQVPSSYTANVLTPQRHHLGPPLQYKE